MSRRVVSSLQLAKVLGLDTDAVISAVIRLETNSVAIVEAQFILGYDDDGKELYQERRFELVEVDP